MEIAGPLGLIGCGTMGGAMLSGWLDRGLAPERIYLVEPNGEAIAPFLAKGCHRVEAPPADSCAVVIAVKPQRITAALEGLGAGLGPQTLYLSLAAGVTIARLGTDLGAGSRIVRCMPNTPAAVGRGMTVLTAGADVTQSQRVLAESLLSAVGETVWVDDEALLDPVTAVSGSGPAYVFFLTETLARAGVAAGLPVVLAERLARATVSGAGELLRRTEEDPAQLRRNVTSPGGTTQAALEVLMAREGLQPLMTAAVAAASRRGRELGKACA